MIVPDLDYRRYLMVYGWDGETCLGYRKVVERVIELYKHGIIQSGKLIPGGRVVVVVPGVVDGGGAVPISITQ